MCARAWDFFYFEINQSVPHLEPVSLTHACSVRDQRQQNRHTKVGSLGYSSTDIPRSSYWSPSSVHAKPTLFRASTILRFGIQKRYAHQHQFSTPVRIKYHICSSHEESGAQITQGPMPTAKRKKTWQNSRVPFRSAHDCYTSSHEYAPF